MCPDDALPAAKPAAKARDGAAPSQAMEVAAAGTLLPMRGKQMRGIVMAPGGVLLVVGVLVVLRVAMNRRAERRGAKGRQPRAKHTRIANRDDGMQLARGRAADGREEEEEEEEDIIGDDQVQDLPVQNRTGCGGGIPRSRDELEKGGKPQAQEEDDEDALMKRVAELLKDESPGRRAGVE